MFMLDVYRFMEGRESFTRQDLAVFIFNHAEVESLAESAGITAKQFAACAAREYIPRLCTVGYLDMHKGRAWLRNKMKRPYDFRLHALNAKESKYLKMMMNVDKLDDSQLFGGLSWTTTKNHSQ